MKCSERGREGEEVGVEKRESGSRMKSRGARALPRLLLLASADSRSLSLSLLFSFFLLLSLCVCVCVKLFSFLKQKPAFFFFVSLHHTTTTISSPLLRVSLFFLAKPIRGKSGKEKAGNVLTRGRLSTTRVLFVPSLITIVLSLSCYLSQN